MVDLAAFQNRILVVQIAPCFPQSILTAELFFFNFKFKDFKNDLKIIFS